MQRLLAVAESYFSRILKDKLFTAINEMAMSLGRGEADSYDSYRQQVGFITGLQTAIDICNDLEKEKD